MRSEPFPQRMASGGQYLSQPQQMRSGFLGFKGKGLAMGWAMESVEVSSTTVDLARVRVKRIPMSNLSEVNSMQMGDVAAKRNTLPARYARHEHRHRLPAAT